MNAESNSLTEVQTSGNVKSAPLEPVSSSVGRSTRKINQSTRMDTSSKKGSTCDIARVQILCMTQIVEAVKGERLYRIYLEGSHSKILTWKSLRVGFGST